MWSAVVVPLLTGLAVERSVSEVSRRSTGSGDSRVTDEPLALLDSWREHPTETEAKRATKGTSLAVEQKPLRRFDRELDNAGILDVGLTRPSGASKSYAAFGFHVNLSRFFDATQSRRLRLIRVW
jgi:hypothetical protein